MKTLNKKVILHYRVQFICFILASYFIINNFIYSQNSAISGAGLQADLSYAVFKSPEKGTYLETYLAINGNSIVYQKKDNGKFQGKLQVIQIFKQNDKIINFEKYNSLSPEIDDTTGIIQNFIDQQRFLLPNGVYDYEIEIKDIYSEGPSFKASQQISVDIPDKILSISDIQLLEAYKKSIQPNIFSKNGYDLVPNVYNFYPASMDKLMFYAEIYNANTFLGEQEQYLCDYFVESYENGGKIGNLSDRRKEDTKPVTPILGELPLNELYTGNYNLVIEVRNKSNIVVASKKVFFQRKYDNPMNLNQNYITPTDTSTFASKITDNKVLYDYIKSLEPIANKIEKNFIQNQVKAADIKLMQQFFYNFWLDRNEINPEKAWLAYKEQVDFVNEKYGTKIKKGYETDRGRVYLQYGPPNSISESKSEPGHYSYEIWHYYKIRTQTNRKFVFYCPDEVTNDYDLIHSDALGEIYDKQWRLKLSPRNKPGNFDIEQGNPHYGNKVDDLYEAP